MNVTVTARCVACQHEREIGPDEIPEGEVPLCEKCFSPMVAVRASVYVPSVTTYQPPRARNGPPQP